MWNYVEPPFNVCDLLLKLQTDLGYRHMIVIVTWSLEMSKKLSML